MKLLFQPFFIICFVLFFIHQIIEKILDIHISFLDNYLDSFLALPIILSLYLVERRKLFKKPDYRFSLLEVIVVSIALSLFFEEVLPQISNGFTKDYYDYLALSLGAVLFWFFGNGYFVKRRKEVF